MKETKEPKARVRLLIEGVSGAKTTNTLELQYPFSQLDFSEYDEWHQEAVLVLVKELGLNNLDVKHVRLLVYSPSVRTTV